jgi:hypothetical protein
VLYMLPVVELWSSKHPRLLSFVEFECMAASRPSVSFMREKE